MLSSPANPKTLVYGVDFSGSKTACKKIWVSRGTIHKRTLHISSCCPISDLMPESIRKDRDNCLAFLQDLISTETEAIFGLDFPFGLPEAILNGQDWESSILNFSTKYESPDDFRAKCRNRTGNKEIKRTTDRQKKAPFCVYNLRLYRQTYYGIRYILEPLLKKKGARIIPMQTPLQHKASVAEICPACTLKRNGIYVPYKGKNNRELENRRMILSAIKKWKIELEEEVMKAALEDTEGDALDSIIAAYASYRALQEMATDIHLAEEYISEGMICD
ncbi:Protein of unknown function [Methanococcoides vulcani]|uniref:DUF429 domain-containing protein n=1 Tax=Methanococcoides vulcani TaxID=1353158 RepID=A0A1I0BD52_9EURY|nr:DUF429 domain-containing protein [Methanococcoides vulcani]SET04420.1 Protein of unknown function [Methanococcoides vulcani]